MAKKRGILGIFHIIIPSYFLLGALYMLLAQKIPFMLLLSISGFIAGLVSIPTEFHFIIPIFLILVSGAGFLIGIGLLGDRPWARKIAISFSFLYLYFIPFGPILGIYTLWVLYKPSARFLKSILAQFAMVAVSFWYFHWIYPNLNEYCRQNPKTSRGIGPQMDSGYVTPLYSTVNPRFKIKSDLVEAHATMALARAKQGGTSSAIKEFQQAIDILKKGSVASSERFNAWIILPLMAMAAYFVTSRAILKSEQAIPASIFLMAIAGLKMAIDVSVALINGGFPAIGMPIGNYLEFYWDVPKVQGIWSFLRDFNNLDLSLHSETHPPGGAFFLWIVARIFNYDLITVSAAIIIFGVLTLIPMYLLAKQLYGEKIARYSLPLYIITPNVVIFSATCMDTVFSGFLIWSIYLYFLAISRRSRLYSVLTGICLAASMVMNFTTTTLGLYFIVFAIITYLGSRVMSDNEVSQHFKTHTKVLFIAGGVFILIYLLLYLGPRYNVFTNLRNATARDRGMMGTGHETIERYIFLSLANLFAFFMFVGVPTTAIWIREAARAIREAFQRTRFDSFLIAYIATLTIISIATLYTLEVERIWMFMLPFITIPVGRHLAAYIEEHKSQRLFYIMSVLLWIQILAFEILLDTRW